MAHEFGRVQPALAPNIPLDRERQDNAIAFILRCYSTHPLTGCAIDRIRYVRYKRGMPSGNTGYDGSHRVEPYLAGRIPAGYYDAGEGTLGDHPAQSNIAVRSGRLLGSGK